jgi:PAS domain S-box-containing protein
MSAVATAASPASIAPSLLWAWLEQSRDLLAITDRSGDITWANERFCQVTGLDGGCNLLALAPLGASGQTTRDVFSMALRGAALADTEIELRSTGNVEIRVQARVVDAAGQLLWTLCDVTAERRQEARAERLAGLLEMAQEFGRLGSWERAIPSGEGQWDRHVFGFWGLPPDDGTPDFERAIRRIHPDDRKLMNYRESTRQAGRYSQHYRVLHPDGSTRWIHSQWEVQNSADGEPVRAVGIMMDDTEAYESAHALGEANAQLKLALDLGKIAIWRHDLQTRRVRYNDGAFALIDMPVRAEGVDIDQVSALIHPDDLPLVVASTRAALRSDKPADTEARYRHSNGSWRTLMTRQVAQRDPSGAPLALLGVALDVTERVEHRRRAEELVRRLDAAAKAARLGIWSIAVAGGAADWNEQMFELFDLAGATAPPCWHDWLERCVHPGDRERVRAAMRGFLCGGEPPPEIEFRSLRRDGSSRWIVVRADIDQPAPGQQRLLGVALDVTEHHRALDALREASERTMLITRHAGIGTWEAELHSDEQHWDEQMFRLRGLEPAEQAPSPEQRLALVHPEDLRMTTGFWPGALDPRQSGAYEFRVRQPDGSYRWLASRSAPVFGLDGEPVRRVGVNWDVTESKNAEQARQEAALAAQAIREKTRFLSRMSHELRTPLNAVLGFTQLLQIEAGKAASATQLAKLAHIRSAGEHLLALINDVLDLSNLESGELQLQLGPVELASLVAEAYALVEPLARRHGIALQVGATPGTVRADAARLRQVLINLLTNAVKYNRRGGRVLIESCGSNGSVVLGVQDTGRGLTPEQLLHLFEPFIRHGADPDGVEGAGIGLTIVKALVERMGGSVSVSSRPGEGTRFEVRLGAEAGCGAAPADDAPTTFSAELERCSRPGQLLYIEDNSVNVMLVEELVRSLSGLQIVSEPTGAAGVERARSLQPDVILIDLQLPDFDGYEVLHRLRAQPETAATPCIALSANALPEDIERGLEAGFSDYWTKPINFKTFLSSLEKLFPSVSLRQDI